MEQGAEWVSSIVTFETSDGVTLTGDLAAPSPTRRSAIAAIVCHPHPQYGGNRFDTVVERCWRALADAGVTAFRFDFRPEFGGGVAERLDATAALDVVAAAQPAATTVAVGYSFGAMVTLGLEDERLAAAVLIAPPLTARPVQVTPRVPTLVLTPAHDQFTPPDEAAEVVEMWRSTNPDVTFEVIEMADHLLVGRAAHAADRTTTWITELAGP